MLETSAASWAASCLETFSILSVPTEHQSTLPLLAFQAFPGDPNWRDFLPVL